MEKSLAGSRGFEPPVSGVTGQRVDRYTTTPQCAWRLYAKPFRAVKVDWFTDKVELCKNKQ